MMFILYETKMVPHYTNINETNIDFYLRNEMNGTMTKTNGKIFICIKITTPTKLVIFRPDFGTNLRK